MNVVYGKGFGLIPVVPGGLIVWDGAEMRFNVTDRRPAAIRASIVKLTQQLLACPDKAEMPVQHTLIDGVYTRRLFIPKNCILVGKIHLKECVNICCGDLSILTETGMGRMRSGQVAASQPGIQKAGIAHEDTYFFNIFRTDETDLDKIEAEIATDDTAALAPLEVEALCL